MTRHRLKQKTNQEVILEEVIDEFIIEKETEGRSKDTITSYQNSFKKFLKFTGEGYKVQDIDNGTIISYSRHLQNYENITLSSVNHYLRDLRTFINWLHDMQYIEKTDVKLVKGQEEVIQIYTDEELQLLLKEPQKKEQKSLVPTRTWLMVCWIMATGNRINTIINVKIGDIHFGQETITIREQKNKKAQNIPLDRNLAIALKKYIKSWRSEASDNDYLFVNVYGEQMTKKAAQEAFRDYSKARGVDKTSLHHLRHTFAKKYVENSGGDVFRLQRILGHSTLDVTRRYVNLFDADLKKDYNTVSPLSDFVKKKGSRGNRIQKSDLD